MIVNNGEPTAARTEAVARSKVVSVADFGLKPNTGQAANAAFQQALQAAGSDATIVFPKGRYDFYQTPGEAQTIAMHLKKCHAITIDGQDSELVFHGKMQVLRLDSCSDICVRGFSTDWDRPWITQAQFKRITPEYVDMKIDKAQYPYEIRDGRAIFIGEGWEAPALDNYQNLYNEKDSCISYRTRDCYTGNIFAGKAEELQPGLVRFYGTMRERPIPVQEGQFITFWHGTYVLTGIEVNRCRNILLEDLTLYHTLSCGVHGYVTENITLRRVNCTPRATKGRVFSTVADAMHFSNCRGHILVEQCCNAGQGDDFININGAYLPIDSIANPRAIFSKGRGWVYNPGDTLWLVNPATVSRGEEVVIESMDKRDGGWWLTFTKPLPSHVDKSYYFENKTWSASATIRQCVFKKKNRARGLLVTTPKPVVIEQNVFETAGTAILIEGDLDHWFESGAHNSLTIRQNVFRNCCTSSSETGDRWEWGFAPINISPSYRPASEQSPTYHRNITISQNVFECFDAPVVYARSVDGLRFEQNVLSKSSKYKPFLYQKSNLWLDGCRNVTIWQNVINSNFPAKTIEIEHMAESEVKQSQNVPSGFKVVRR